MKILITSRNIVNAEDLDQWLTDNVVPQYPTLAAWILGPVRKWCLKSAEARPATVDTQNMPDWLRRAMEGGEPPESIVLDTALLATITPVLDYVQSLLNDRPDTNISQIGYSTAEKRMLAQREQQALDAQRKHKKVNPVDETGTVVLIKYNDGYTWRQVVGDDALAREGDLMGHCVGNGGYWPQVLRGLLTIVSLRDADNNPHVTLQLSHDGLQVLQIKGRANKSIVDRYVPRVFDFLKTRTWTAVHYDQSPGLSDLYGAWLAQQKSYYSYGGHEARINLSLSKATVTHYNIINTATGKTVSSFGAEMRNGNPAAVVSMESSNPDAMIGVFVRHMIVDKKLALGNISDIQELLGGTTWTNKGYGWCEPVGDEAKLLVSLVTRGSSGWLYIERNVMEAYCDDQTGVLAINGKTAGFNSTPKYYTEIVDESPKSAKTVSFYSRSLVPDAVDVALTTRLQKRNAGASVKTGGTDHEFLDSLLTALNQPSVNQIHADLRRVQHVNDHAFMNLGYKTGGRSFNLIATVLLCSVLPPDMLESARVWVFNKPVALNCWLETIVQPNHLSQSLLGYRLDPDTIERVLSVLRNEYLRLVPSTLELDALELDSAVKTKVVRAQQWATAHKQDRARSRALWKKDGL